MQSKRVEAEPLLCDTIASGAGLLVDGGGYRGPILGRNGEVIEVESEACRRSFDREQDVAPRDPRSIKPMKSTAHFFSGMPDGMFNLRP